MLWLFFVLISYNVFLSRATLFEPRSFIRRALELLRDETNEKLPEGQLRLLVKDTLSQLEQFMKTLGCELS